LFLHFTRNGLHSHWSFGGPFGSVIRMVLVLEYAAKLPNKKSLKALPEAAWCGQEEEIGDKYLDAQSDRLMDFWSAW
jgi:hypothetical protein